MDMTGTCLCWWSYAHSGTPISELVDSREVIHRLDRISFHGLGPGLPVCRADLAVDVGVLEGVDQSQSLINIASNRQVVDGDLA